ncbi:MAG TPA: DUF5077 domain-containing protein [Pedobacter sp.]|nr:DUF5077 domain-containing protein [Pedobacter sp.]
MKNIFYFFLLFAIVINACSKKEATAIIKPPIIASSIKGPKVAIALGGNAFITNSDGSFNEKIDDSGSNGLTGWTSSNTTISIYFKVIDTGSINLFLRGRVDGGFNSDIKVSIADQTIVKKITNSGLDTISIGKFNLKTKGYVKVDLQGVTKTGANFGTITDLLVQGSKVTNSLVYVKDNLTNHYYWGRRGPSVHLTYTMPIGVGNVQCFYNEVTVPTGQDAIGSYFMSNGFDGGYFGMQVKSATERWLLFSVWDPASGTSTAIRSGTNVTTQRFGGEGTGGQAYMVYNWKAGNTYKFLTQAQPDGAGNTLYSSWFYAPELGAWSFMATWKRPETASKYLTGLYSFLENFANTKGYLARSADYGNSWVRNSVGVWTEVNVAKFTGDDIAKINYRQDFAGGLRNNRFYLQNGGFFSDNTMLNTTFTRPIQNVAPIIDFNSLP